MNLLPNLKLNAFSSLTVDCQETYAHVICVLKFKFNINNRVIENHPFGEQMPKVLDLILRKTRKPILTPLCLRCVAVVFY